MYLSWNCDNCGKPTLKFLPNGRIGCESCGVSKDNPRLEKMFKRMHKVIECPKCGGVKWKWSKDFKSKLCEYCGYNWKIFK
jgi:DNA-directed RNA polymerase subunit RPC12/RpoP